MRNKLKGLAFLCMVVALPLTAQNVTVNGPDGKLQLTVSCPEGKEALYSLAYNGKQMLESSPLGLETNVGDFAKLIPFTRNRVSKLPRYIIRPMNWYVPLSMQKGRRWT